MRQLWGFTLALGVLGGITKGALLCPGSPRNTAAVGAVLSLSSGSASQQVCWVWFLPSYKSTSTEVLTRSTSPSHGSILCRLCQQRKAESPLWASPEGNPAGSAFSSYKSFHAANRKFQIQAKHSLLWFHHPCGYQQRSWSNPRLPCSVFTPMLLYTYSITLGIIKIINKCN